MNKETEIAKLLEEDMTPVEIIEGGYKKSTVYKVYRYYTGKEMKKGTVRIRYSIIGLRQKADSVLLTLREYRPPPPPEELERARLEAELEEEPEPIETEGQLKKVDFTPPPRTAEEKLFAAMKTQVPELFEGLKSLGMPPFRPPERFSAMGPRVAVVRPPLELWVSNEQYRELGCPAIFQVITLTLKLGA